MPSALDAMEVVIYNRVEDLDASITYYVDCLGFQVEWRYAPVASVVRDRMSIMLAV